MKRIKINTNDKFLKLKNIYVNFLPFKTKFYPVIAHDENFIYLSSRLQKKYISNYTEYLRTFNRHKHLYKPEIINEEMNLCLLEEFNIIGHTVEQLAYLNLLKEFNGKKILFAKSDKDDAKFYMNYINFYKKVAMMEISYLNIDSNKLYFFKDVTIPNLYYKNLRYNHAINEYSMLLYKHINPLKKHQNTYNIKFNDDMYSASIKRGFNNNINEILEKNNYKKLPNDNEEIKLKNLYESNNIILSWGSSHTINLIFSSSNLNSNFLILCHFSYKKEYNNLIKNINCISKNGYRYGDLKFVGNNCRFIFDLESEIKNKILDIVDDFNKKYNYS